MKTVLTIIGVLFGIIPNCNGAICTGKLTLKAEWPTIKRAADRNRCVGDDYLLLLAIRKAENGRAGLEFGIMNPKANNLDKQAGWAAATIVKHHKRFGDEKVTAEFIDSLANRYCPAAVDPEGNRNWKKNVRFWFEKFKREGKVHENLEKK